MNIYENDKIDIPLGLGMALAQDMKTLNFFAALPTEQKKIIINETHYIKSKEEMREFVNALSYDASY